MCWTIGPGADRFTQYFILIKNRRAPHMANAPRRVHESLKTQMLRCIFSCSEAFGLAFN
jgi:hypothetical protein